MKIKESKRNEMIAYEAFIRRAAAIDMPFVLKGSFVTRQYFSDPNLRIPADLDWLYLPKIKKHKQAKKIFDKWAIAVTEYSFLEDNTIFQSFKKNQFWRMIEYAMEDDFPTVNSDLVAWVNEEELDLFIDISFNLNKSFPTVPLFYQPIFGEPFLIKHTVPLYLQIAWKMHQSIVRLRFKDLFDLMHLVIHPTFNKNMVAQVMEELIEECEATNVKTMNLRKFLTFKKKHLQYKNIEKDWLVWRHKDTKTNHYFYADPITDVSLLPENLDDFLEQFKNTMKNAGFGNHLLSQLASFWVNLTHNKN